jgi:site-specific DNA recombinase
MPPPSVCVSGADPSSQLAPHSTPGAASNSTGRKEDSMSTTQAALYARVSSDVQQEARTIESQVADLRACSGRRGLLLAPELEFVDDGYSGATLVRPALERLRDVAAAGGIDQLYVHCPDRLARNYAYQVLRLGRVPASGSRGDLPQPRSGSDPRGPALAPGRSA